MSKKYMDEYRDPEIAGKIAEDIRKLVSKEVRFMEVCGTHTMSIFRSGIRTILPESISLLSGPGCPVCVTAQSEINAFIEIARMDDVIVTTFGDLMKVPGTDSSLQEERANGRDIRIVYSANDAIRIAGKNPDKKVVFLGVGFETTAPTIAASILVASRMKLNNFLVYSAHKLVPPALAALLEAEKVELDGFLLPGHISVIIGSDAYVPIVEKYHMPSVVAGFEPVDLLYAILMLVEQIRDNAVRVDNAYPRAVTREGNERAKKILSDVFDTVDAAWRGIGIIAGSGLVIRDEFSSHDARKVLDVPLREVEDPKGCCCGDILTGVKIPPACPLYKKICTPINPVGPCMVSTEGTCAAYYRYQE
ncbi:MAG: hydrogenase formation protein HypD [Desulfobulbaceae bacterium]|nr:hydrogenase formation protein HypD [Desulfobulbaceae bacterium]